ncbi:copper amine oxidase N-terminal domain-containing protein [Natronincola ferrireducens]|uniref:Copper amine oxidase N-terminal domain-containing protein n=1 Tax=Natronincola ferrireducens TaxID=393762 RepID=A0A1G8X3T5_9FIRM|nr:copper amine oxidase N-terminal domain-containing protein [Natronincola ferrireducens]SDJ84430.1 Copper amine oxidase N-terminal domain-containing protein [Natronincola ferrireducens]
MKKKYPITKQVGTLALGIIIGMMLMIPAVASASNTSITASLANHITMYFNGEAKSLPEGYDLLTYQGRTYTPARFVAEELGAEVDWDGKTHSIYITYDEKTEEATDDQRDEPQEKPQPKKDYKALPLTKISPEAQVMLTTVVLDNKATTVYLEIEGRSNTPIQLRQSTAKLEVDGRVYTQEKLTNIVNPIDDRWYHDIRNEQRTSGWIKFPEIDPDTENLSLYLQLINNDGSNEVTEFEFNIAL